MHERYFLGLPAWAFPGWKGRYFPDVPSRLSSYARVFNAVEGNTTFYRVPDADSVARWSREVAGTRFRFCFKMPRKVTHERRPDRRVLDGFLRAIGPLGPHLGPLLVQFPATVAPEDLPAFEPVFESARRIARLVIEVRHRAFFETPEALDPVLAAFDADRVIFDSRPLFAGDREHPDVRAARHRKPRVPLIDRAPQRVAMVRLIFHPDVGVNAPYIDEWAARAARKLSAGQTLYMMIHCPNNVHCPPLARRFHEALCDKLPTGVLRDLPPWPLPHQGTLL